MGHNCGVKGVISVFGSLLAKSHVASGIVPGSPMCKACIQHLKYLFSPFNTS